MGNLCAGNNQGDIQRKNAGFKFYYFDAYGRGEAARILLNHAGVKFEDIRIQQSDWGNQKASMPNGQIPCL